MESNTIDKVINALKAIVRLALCQGFSKTSYLVINYIKYIKNIRTADDPERYISLIAKKLFPDEATTLKRFENIQSNIKRKVNVISRMLTKLSGQNSRDERLSNYYLFFSEVERGK